MASIVLVTTDVEKNSQLTRLGVDMLEIRVDLMRDVSVQCAMDLCTLRHKTGIPLLLTVRDDWREGAQKPLSKKLKIELIESCLPLCDWIDIELSSPMCPQVIRLAKRLKKKVIVSSHHFKQTPKNLSDRYIKAMALGADLVKFACMVKNENDFLNLVEITRRYRMQGIVTMAVGPWGPLSRVILPQFGSRFVYTFLSNATAPGQLDIRSLKKLMSAAGL